MANVLLEDKPPQQPRVNHYWYHIFTAKSQSNSNLKYPMLTQLIKIALVLLHSNSDGERSLSVNNRLVTKEVI